MQRFVIPITLLILNFLDFLKLFFLKLDMLYNIFEAFPPFPNLKGILFSKARSSEHLERKAPAFFATFI